MADSVTVVVNVGAPAEPAVAITRSETIVVDSGDTEALTIEALRMIDRLCTEVRAEALRQTRVVMENVKAANASGSG